MRLNESVVLKGVLVNPTHGSTTAGFDKANSYLLNYSTNTGVLQVYGDYLVSGLHPDPGLPHPAIHLHRDCTQSDCRVRNRPLTLP